MYICRNLFMSYLCPQNYIYMREWLFLIGAIVLETFATSMLKYSEQFTKLLPTIAMIVGYGLSFYLLSHALRTMPIGIAYAIWSALGIVLITLVGVIAFKQVPDLPAYIGIALIMAGVIIINLFSKMEVH